MSGKIYALLLSALKLSHLKTSTEGRVNITAYTLTFHTCDVPGADFNFGALVILKGERGETSEKLTVLETEGGFDQGSKVSVDVSTSFTGPVCSVLLWKETTNTGQGWKLEQLDVHGQFGMTSFVINECDVEDDWVKERETEYERTEGINGGWSEWGPWSTGDVRGIRRRYRTCDDPPPMCGGEQCYGSSSQATCFRLRDNPPTTGGREWGHGTSTQVNCSSPNCDKPTSTDGMTVHEYSFMESSFPILMGVLISMTSLLFTMVICSRANQESRYQSPANGFWKSFISPRDKKQGTKRAKKVLT